MKTAIKVLSALVLFAAPAVSMAHPGHGNENPLSPVHYLANPEHAVPLAVTVVAVVILGWMWKVKTSKANDK